MKLSTHQLAHMLLAQKDQPVYTCDYAGADGELTMYPVSCVDSNIIQDGTIICTSEDGIPFSAFAPVDPLDFVDIADQLANEIRVIEDKRMIDLLKQSRDDICHGRTYSVGEALIRLDMARAKREAIQ